MKKLPIKNMNYVDLLIFVKAISGFIKRDSAEFIQIGKSREDLSLSEENLSLLEENLLNLEALPTIKDDYKEANIQVEIKRELAKSVEYKLSQINLALKSVFNGSSLAAEFRKIKNYTNKTSRLFVSGVKEIILLAEDNASALLKHDVTKADIDSLKAKLDLYIDSVDIMNKKKKLKASNTKKRKVIMIELRKDSLRLAKIGRKIWKNKDAAKYNDYSLDGYYSTPKPKPYLTYLTDLRKK